MWSAFRPFSVEAEQGVLGCVLQAGVQTKGMLSKLEQRDFFDLRHREVFTACVCLVTDGASVDLLALHQWLKDKGRLEAAGGLSYLTALPDATPSPVNFEYYIAILKEKSQRRALLQFSARLSDMAYNETLDPRALMHEAKTDCEYLLHDETDKKDWFHFRTPSECRAFDPPENLILVGDCHITRGAVTVVAGPPGVGKSRAADLLAVSGATRKPWFALPVNRQFKTAILQNENGLYRLKREFTEIGAEALDEFIRISEPPPFGMVFERSEFRTALAKWLEEWQPDVVVLDPWNSAARDDGQRDYLEVFQSLKEVLPKGDVAPALVIVAHTRKPRGEERKTGRGLLNEIAGSHVLATVPRSAFVLLHASDDPEDDRVVWTCSKNNDGELGGRTAWHRRNGLFLLFLPRVVISQENICAVDFLPGPAHRRIRHGVIETRLYLGRLRELTRDDA